MTGGPDDTGRLVIDPRYCGPPGTGNGGYVCGLLAGRLGGSAEITLRQPPPVGIALAVGGDSGGLVSLSAGEAVVATAAALPGGPDLELPEPVGLAEATAAGAGCRLRQRPDEHPYPGCFVCGPDRADGLQIMVGPVAGRDLAADAWWPDPALAGPDGTVGAEFLWAALDCPGGMGAIGNEFQSGPPWVLGRFAACQAAPVRAGEPHVAVGWRLAREGRKMPAGSAVFTAAGEVAGYALATWIQLR